MVALYLLFSTLCFLSLPLMIALLSNTPSPLFIVELKISTRGRPCVAICQFCTLHPALHFVNYPLDHFLKWPHRGSVLSCRERATSNQTMIKYWWVGLKF
ncbi:hypothetical protein XENTR_v10008750 [Xenopus tropicalis]|nr:hypothetical protein XENTR_v10008750 [Xenopus tropicalis]